jgi:hypothetical protein
MYSFNQIFIFLFLVYQDSFFLCKNLFLCAGFHFSCDMTGYFFRVPKLFHVKSIQKLNYF